VATGPDRRAPRAEWRKARRALVWVALVVSALSGLGSAVFLLITAPSSDEPLHVAVAFVAAYLAHPALIALHLREGSGNWAWRLGAAVLLAAVTPLAGFAVIGLGVYCSLLPLAGSYVAWLGEAVTRRAEAGPG